MPNIVEMQLKTYNQASDNAADDFIATKLSK